MLTIKISTKSFPFTKRSTEQCSTSHVQKPNCILSINWHEEISNSKEFLISKTPKTQKDKLQQMANKERETQNRLHSSLLHGGSAILLGSSVGPCPLSSARQAIAMPNSSVALNIHQSPHVSLNVTPLRLKTSKFVIDSEQKIGKIGWMPNLAGTFNLTAKLFFFFLTCSFNHWSTIVIIQIIIDLQWLNCLILVYHQLILVN